MSNISDEANEAIEKKLTRDREKIAEKRKRAREHSSPQELDEQRRKHANAQRHTTLWDAIYDGDLSLVVWLIEIIGLDVNHLRSGVRTNSTVQLHNSIQFKALRKIAFGGPATLGMHTLCDI